jgi:hypothetical protein
MSTLVKNGTRTFQIELPESLAHDVEELSRERNLSLDELFQDAIRLLQLDRIHQFMEAERPQSYRDAEDRQMDEVCAMIKEMRKQDVERDAA